MAAELNVKLIYGEVQRLQVGDLLVLKAPMAYNPRGHNRGGYSQRDIAYMHSVVREAVPEGVKVIVVPDDIKFEVKRKEDHDERKQDEGAAEGG